MVFINIRGTGGSGKTTLVNRIAESFRYKQHLVSAIQNEGKIAGYLYRAELEDKPQLAVVGNYETTCGGCDTIKTQDEIIKRAVEFSHLAKHVIFEGLLMSTISERYMQFGRQFPTRFVFLSTPVEQCIKSIIDRRTAKGNLKPLNHEPTIAKHRTIERQQQKFRDAGLDVYVFDREQAFTEIMGWLK